MNAIDPNIRNIASRFQTLGSFAEARPYGSGHIHDTFLVTAGPHPGKRYLLQRMNHHVFRNISGLMSNIERVTSHLRAKLAASPGHDPERECLTLIPTLDGSSFLQDGEGCFWRMYLFIPDSHSYDRATDPVHVAECGRAFGRFITLVSDLPGERLCDTIPAFHDLENRLRNFRDSVRTDSAGRVSGVSSEIRFVEIRAEAMCVLQHLGRTGDIAERVTHNDTKINNVLFDSNNSALCVVDLDTVMPGYVHFDFGDAIRTGANTGAEDEADLGRVSINLPFFAAFARGFLEETAAILTRTEIETLAFSANYMTFIIGLRFLTDHLDGDRYYKIHFPGHNLQRARAQFKLIESMEAEKRKMQETVLKTAELFIVHKEDDP